MSDFSHLNKKHEAIMVDISQKNESSRMAAVQGTVQIDIKHKKQFTNTIIKEIINTAKIAGIIASKYSSILIPHCHQISLTHIDIDISFKKDRFIINSKTKAYAKTGVEMEAFLGCQITALTIYDMIKAIVPNAIIGPFKLINKTGGKKNFTANKNTK